MGRSRVLRDDARQLTVLEFQKMNQLMQDTMYRDIVVTTQARLRMAYELLADVRNMSVGREVREIIGQDGIELTNACTWLKRRLRAIECALGNPQCLECGCPMEESKTTCTVCAWQRG